MPNKSALEAGASLPNPEAAFKAVDPDSQKQASSIRSLSIVIPFLNEAESLPVLYGEILAAVEPLDIEFEIIFVNDGSNDGGDRVAADIARSDSRAALIDFRRNFGKAAALSAGFAEATGDVVITMDADLQDNPVEIPRFLEAVDNGADVVSGWKHVRNDPVDKTLPSKVFNAITARAFGLKLHDINCGFKAYRKESLGYLNLYGELHRFTPALLNSAGFKVDEIKVDHRSRIHGKSKYGFSRFIKGILDLITVLVLTRYGARPSHFFAMLGIPLFVLGTAFLSYLTVLWFMDRGPIGTRPLLQIGILFIVTGVQLLATGLIAELVIVSRLTERDKYSKARVIRKEAES